MNRIENETVQTQSKPVTPSVQGERSSDDEEEAVNRIENETAQTQSKRVTPSIQHLAQERPTEEEEGTFTEACR